MLDTSDKYKKMNGFLHKKSLLLLFAGVLALFLFISFSTDFNSLMTYVASADYRYYALAFISTTLNVFALAISWLVLLKSASIRLRLSKVLEVTWITNYLNIIVPAASFGGEVFRIWYAVEETKDNYGKVTATVFLHRVIVFLPFIFGSFIGFLYLAIFHNLPTYMIGLLLIFSAFLLLMLLILLLLSIKPKLAMRMALKIIHFINKIINKGKNDSKLAELTTRTFEEFEQSLKVLERKSPLLISGVFAFVYWIFDVLVAYFVFLSLGISIPVGVIIAVYTISVSIQVLPLGIPGMVGIQETVMSGLYTISGIPLGLSVAATIMIRLVMTWYEALVGGTLFVLYSRRK
jgi:hypothetical protein